MNVITSLLGFFSFFQFILLLYFCYHHSVPDLPLLLCVLLSYRFYSDEGIYHWYCQALRLYQAVKISCSPHSLNLVWLSPAYSLGNLQHIITSPKDIICCFLTKQRKLHC